MIERPPPVLSNQLADLAECAGDTFRREWARVLSGEGRFRRRAADGLKR